MVSLNRVTEQSTSARVLAGLQNGQSRLERLREQVTTGKQVGKPSDSPIGTISAMEIRSDMATRGRYARSATDGVARLGTAENALTTASDLINQVRDRVLQGMSSPAAGDPAAREAIASEIAALRDTLLSVGNTTYLGRPVFGGTTSGEQAFDTTTGAYIGDSGQVQRRVADGVQVRVDVPASVFGTGSNQLFAVLDSVVAKMKTDPTTLSGDLDRLDSAQRAVSTEIAGVGTRYSQLTSASDAAEAQTVSLTSRLSDIEDVDLAKAVIDLQTQNVGYEAALAATARVVQPSLLDFLR
ncbi:flagellin N-terminal helical domain-containing protein [Actinophytocola xanthii]|uniref:Flagellin n=1 Tax=Actinophytocola xanthii TaxID=1912961 RepID=A0A1Q8CYD4_9PSEU|nr:flagellin [Actinophytocola xanthii]OLF19368.1 flagellar hook-associated protein 3 [Actinophytocola xanthii]